MNLTPFEITEAVGRLTALSMFPTNPAAHTEIMRLIDRMVGTREQLDWLVGAMIDQVGAWHGTAELPRLSTSRRFSTRHSAFCAVLTILLWATSHRP